MDLSTSNVTFLSSTFLVRVHFQTSIRAPFVAKKGLSKINGISSRCFSSTSISNTTKFTGKINLSILTITSWMRALGYVIVRLANWRCVVVDFNSPSFNFQNIEKDMMLTLVPSSHRTLLKEISYCARDRKTLWISKLWWQLHSEDSTTLLHKHDSFIVFPLSLIRNNVF